MENADVELLFGYSSLKDVIDVLVKNGNKFDSNLNDIC